VTAPRILMADDHSLVLAGLRKLVEGEGDVVGMVEYGQALVEEALRLRPDVILLDISMPLLNGLDAARQLSKLVPESKLIFLTMHATPTYVVEAFKAGAKGYLIKRSAASELKQAIQAVLRGQSYLTPLITKDVLAAMVQSPEGQASRIRPVSSLTPRQREVLQLVAEGKGTKAIAGMLNISVKTVEFHKFRLMGELDLHSTAELTKYAIVEGLVSVSS
jgi:DNA-binding NarL/FixJ family response regulator